MMLDEIFARGSALASQRILNQLSAAELVLLDAHIDFQREQDRIVVRGKGLQRRMLEDSRLRFLGLMT